MLNTICAVTATFIVFGTANIIACKFHISFYSVFISGKSFRRRINDIYIYIYFFFFKLFLLEIIGPGMFFIAVSHAVKDLPFPEVLTLWSFFVLFVICILTQVSTCIHLYIIQILNVYQFNNDTTGKPGGLTNSIKYFCFTYNIYLCHIDYIDR
jgi:hypothetical protein